MDERLAEIKQRLSGITPPPWILMPPLCGPDGQGVYHAESMGLICEVGDPYPRGDNAPQENMTLIAHAADDLAWLVRRVEALEGALTTMGKALDHMDECASCGGSQEAVCWEYSDTYGEAVRGLREVLQAPGAAGGGG